MPDATNTVRSSHRPPMLTTADVAAHLRISTNEAARLIRTGAWPAVKVARQWLTRPADLDAYVASCPRNI